jgi:SAM-dependent methyltransferase
MTLPPDPTYTAQHYNLYAEREWERHDTTWAARTSFVVHRRFLEEFVRSGDLVLDAGAGPGRFTIELADLGARVHVGDISPVQLRLNAEKVRVEGKEDAVVARTLLDICDLSGIEDDRFDAVVCFGGPVSYAMNRVDDAVGELCRVTRPGGHVLMSVMSRLGSLRRFLRGVLDVGRTYGPERNDEIVSTGDLPRDINEGHECHMFAGQSWLRCSRHTGESLVHRPRTSSLHNPTSSSTQRATRSGSRSCAGNSTSAASPECSKQAPTFSLRSKYPNDDRRGSLGSSWSGCCS